MMAENKELNPTETTETAEATETAEESRVVEKDGEIFISMDTDETDPETDPSEEGQSGEDNQEDQGTADKETAVDDSVNDPYAGKSVEDVIEMHKDASRKITEQGNTLSELKASPQQTNEPVAQEDLSANELLEKMSSAEIEDVYKTQQSKLNEMDTHLDEQAYNEQNALVQDLALDLLKKRQDERFTDGINAEENKKFLAEAKEGFKKTGIDLSDEEFSSVAEIAKMYTNNGKLNDNSMQKAMIDQVGVEKMVKFYSMNGEEKARSDIANASKKVQNKVDVRGSGKNGKLVNINNMSQYELSKTLQNMSLDEVNELYKKANT